MGNVLIMMGVCRLMDSLELEEMGNDWSREPGTLTVVIVVVFSALVGCTFQFQLLQSVSSLN